MVSLDPLGVHAVTLLLAPLIESGADAVQDSSDEACWHPLPGQ